MEAILVASETNCIARDLFHISLYISRIMKKNLLVLLAVLLSIVTGCKSTRYITERYIKNNIEEHDAAVQHYPNCADLCRDA
jgi:hypothetical protein